ncbi:MAG: hypothetical protein Q9220_000890 [cf. Caloplaca sp. 1 TL-2023]
MASKRVLLLGGHGKVSLLLTPHLVARSWHVTSVIRDPSHEKDILSTVTDSAGKIDVLVSSLEDVKSKTDAQRIIDRSKPNFVIWSAGMLKPLSPHRSWYLGSTNANIAGMVPGAGGKGDPSRTQVVDRDSCIFFIRAAADTPSVTKFLLVSYLGSRRNQPPWWSDEEWKGSQEVNQGVLKQYYPSKLASDECLTAVASQGKELQAIVLRPGRLVDEKGTGKVSLGKTKASGSVSREDVAATAAELLDSDARGWIDLLEGDEPIPQAVSRVAKEKVDCVEGEDIASMVQQYT